MPSAALRPCRGGCGTKVAHGRCLDCDRARERRRGSAASRGYDSTWQRFRAYFISLLISVGIVPVCGAALPGGPQTSDSQCQAAGLLNGEDLHLDHEPPLADDERHEPAKVCDPGRIQLLCRECHARKTFRGR